MIPTTTLIETATALADVLEQENIALRAVDYAAATRLGDAKASAIAAFAEAAARPAAIAPARSDDARRVARRIDDAVTENRVLLERAMVVQRHVIASLVRAIPRPPVPRYGASGGLTPSHARAPVALVARA